MQSFGTFDDLKKNLIKKNQNNHCRGFCDWLVPTSSVMSMKMQLNILMFERPSEEGPQRQGGDKEEHAGEEDCRSQDQVSRGKS